jgi:hypothetical protein
MDMSDVVVEPTSDFPTLDSEWRDFWMLTRHRGGRPAGIVAQFQSLDALIGVARSALAIGTSAALIESMLPGREGWYSARFRSSARSSSS